MEFLSRQIKIFFTNCVGLICVSANLFLVVAGVLLTGDDIHSFHFYYEPLPVKIAVIINLPAILAADLTESLLFPPTPRAQSSLITVSNLNIFLTSVWSILQWLLFGYVCKLIFPKKLK
ncbi:MAG: hypothetical protein M3384_14120 [Acidobacteriota bacterium]|nr:hypothetical protein [Acidobacteriota bacterium]